MILGSSLAYYGAEQLEKAERPLPIFPATKSKQSRAGGATTAILRPPPFKALRAASVGPAADEPPSCERRIRRDTRVDRMMGCVAGHDDGRVFELPVAYNAFRSTNLTVKGWNAAYVLHDVDMQRHADVPKRSRVKASP